MCVCVSKTTTKTIINNAVQVRFNAASALRSLGESGLASEVVASKIVPCLKKMKENDTDRDVKYLSEQCLVRSGSR